MTADKCAGVNQLSGWKLAPFAVKGPEPLPAILRLNEILCRFELENHLFLEDAARETATAQLRTQYSEVQPDCPLLGAHTESSELDRMNDRRLMQGLRVLGLHRAGARPRSNAWPAAATPRVTVAVLDDVPNAYSDQWTTAIQYLDTAEPRHAHGLSVMGIIDDVACGVLSCRSRGDQRWLAIRPHQALSFAGYHSATGDLTTLALEILAAASYRDGKKIINLSVGWDPVNRWLRELDESIYPVVVDPVGAQWKWKGHTLDLPTYAVLFALTAARCEESLVFAAAGNAASCPDDKGSEEPVLPAAWSGLIGPSSDVCARLGARETAPRRALLHAVGALDSENQFLGTSRERAKPTLAALGEGMVSHNAETGFEILHGSSAATAVVSAAAALAWKQYPGKTADEIVLHLKANAETLAIPSNWLGNTGTGVKRVRPCVAAKPAGCSSCQCAEPGDEPTLTHGGALSAWVLHRLDRGKDDQFQPEPPSQAVKPQPNDLGCKKCGVIKSGGLVAQVDPAVARVRFDSVTVRFDGAGAPNPRTFPLNGQTLSSGAGTLFRLGDASSPNTAWPQNARPLRATLAAHVTYADGTAGAHSFDLWVE